MSLHDINKYMLTRNFINTIDSNNINKKNDRNGKKDELQKKNIVVNDINQKVKIKFHDTAFWCYYILKYGIEEYNSINKKFFTIEKEEKIKNIEMIKKNNMLLKNNKLKSIEVELNLLNDKYTTLTSFLALCLYNNINVLLIRNCTFFQLKITDEPIKHVIHYDKIFSCELNSNNIDNYYGYYEIENIVKPIKCASFYKVNEIQDICNKFKINLYFDTGKKKTKTELYNEILSKL